MGCFSCLTNDRNLSSLGNYRRMFELIITDFCNIFDLQWQDIRVCWECKATIKKCSEFAQKVQSAQIANMLVVTESPPKDSLSSLKVGKMRFVNILSEEESYDVPIVKTEQHNHIENNDALKIKKELPIKQIGKPANVFSKESFIRDGSKHPRPRRLNSPVIEYSYTNILVNRNANQKVFTEKYEAREFKQPSTDVTHDSNYDSDSTICTEDVSCSYNDVKYDFDNKKRTVIELRKNSDVLRADEEVRNIERIQQVNKRSVPKIIELRRNVDTFKRSGFVKRFNPNQKRKNIAKTMGKKISEKDKVVRSTSSKASVSEKTFDTRDKFMLNPMTEQELVKTWNAIKNSEAFVNSSHKCEKCLLTYHSPSLLETHMEKHVPKPGLVKCSICEVYVSPFGLHTHEGFHYHKYDCLLCDHVSYFKGIQAWRHYDECHFGTNVKCDKCPERFSSATKYRLHYNETHNVAATCKECKQTFTKLYAYNKHMENHSQLSTCKKCSLSFKTRNEYRRHYSKAHPPKMLSTPGYCSECKIQYKNMASYNAHIRDTLAHANKNAVPTFECDLCGKKYLLKNLLKSHIKIMHMTALKKCPHCPRIFRKAYSYEQHIKVAHEGYQRPRSHICDQCGKGFTNKKILSDHMTIHTGERPYKCPFCSSDFGFKGALFTHKRLVHKVPRKRETDNGKTVPKVPPDMKNDLQQI